MRDFNLLDFVKNLPTQNINFIREHFNFPVAAISLGPT